MASAFDIDSSFSSLGMGFIEAPPAGGLPAIDQMVRYQRMDIDNEEKVKQQSNRILAYKEQGAVYDSIIDRLFADLRAECVIFTTQQVFTSNLLHTKDLFLYCSAGPERQAMITKLQSNIRAIDKIEAVLWFATRIANEMSKHPKNLIYATSNYIASVIVSVPELYCEDVEQRDIVSDIMFVISGKIDVKQRDLNHFRTALRKEGKVLSDHMKTLDEKKVSKLSDVEQYILEKLAWMKNTTQFADKQDNRYLPRRIASIMRGASDEQKFIAIVDHVSNKRKEQELQDRERIKRAKTESRGVADQSYFVQDNAIGASNSNSSSLNAGYVASSVPAGFAGPIQPIPGQSEVEATVMDHAARQLLQFGQIAGHQELPPLPWMPK